MLWQHRGEHIRGRIAEDQRRAIDTSIAAIARMVPDAGDTPAFDDPCP